MVAERIEQLKREYTDKYVKVDAAYPELARFRDIVGQVKTVNMNGRALVEFLDYHLNIGWYDVDLSCLEIVDKPPPKVEKKPEAKKPADKPTAKAAPAAKAPAKPAASGKPSVADILAAARGAKSAPAAKSEASPASASGSAAEKPAASTGAPAPPKVDRAKMSVADMLAAARAGKGGAPAGAAAPTPAKPAPPAPEPKPAAPEPASAASAPAKAAAGGAKVDRNSMSLDDKIAYCREKDAK